MKNEKPYVKEWINYYSALGVSNFYIYDNSDNNELQHLQTKNIEIIAFPGRVPERQVAAHNHFLNVFKHLNDWVLYFDIDEFLVLHKHENITNFCKYVSTGALGVNVYLFGNNGHEKYEDNLVLKRFTRRQKGVNQHVKTIAKCSDITSMWIHFPTGLAKGQYLDTNKKIINGAFNPDGPSDICQLNHYYCKSTEEFIKKCRPSQPSERPNPRIFEEIKYCLDFNDVEDLAAFNFYKNYYTNKFKMI